ncbi:MAG: hypothetical protein KIT58_23100 [Planctomycetota bacterium]|nr:hypothetical protein [Planctomycetota bacterium]
MSLARRGLLRAALASGALAALGPARVAFGETRGLFVFVFLRGGCDGLHLVGPSAAREYADARPPELRVLVLRGDVYEDVAPDAEGWVASPTWARAFRLRRLVDPVGLPEFRLDVR